MAWQVSNLYSTNVLTTLLTPFSTLMPVQPGSPVQGPRLGQYQASEQRF